jgi:hypothetical protein
VAKFLHFLVERTALRAELFTPGSVRLRKVLRKGVLASLGLVEFMLDLAILLVELQQFIHVQIDAFDLDRPLYRIWVVPDELFVEHGAVGPRIGAHPGCGMLRGRYQATVEA